MNAVERRGDSVLRNAGPWTPTVHRYLNYLSLAGIEGVPRASGIEGDRERLSFLEGDVPLYPLPTWVWEDTVLVEGSQLLRELHDASIGFGKEDAIWQSPSKVPAEVICHNDFAPHNLVFVDGHVVGAIDFDMCSPGPRLWDLAYFATRAVPLTAVTPDGAPGIQDVRRRVDLILSAYGSDARFQDVLRVAIIRLHDLAQMSRSKAVELAQPELVSDANDYERDATFLRNLMSDGL